MAALVVTPAAFAYIRSLIELEEMARPLVCVSWHSGDADLRRGAGGEAIWIRGAPKWVAGVLDAEELEKAGAEAPEPSAHIGEYSFVLTGKAEAPLLQGCTLTVENGKLVVLEHAV